jgi:hypothetical protein
MLAEVGDAVTLIVGVIVGVCTGLVCWVQPATRRPATMQRPMIIWRVFFDIMIIP